MTTLGANKLVLTSGGDGHTRLDGQLVTDVLGCRAGHNFRVRLEDGTVIEHEAVKHVRVTVSTTRNAELPRRVTRIIFAVDEGVTSRFIEQLTYQAQRELSGDSETRVSAGRVEVWLRDPGADEVGATEYRVFSLQSQEEAEERLSQEMFAGHDPFLGMSDQERVELGLL